MFAGLYSGQVRRWLAAGFDPAQIVVLPMDCYVGKPGGVAAALSLIGEVAGLQVGKSLGALDRRFAPENEKRLRQIAGDGSKAGAANRHGEQPIPLAAAGPLKTFFRHEGRALAELLAAHPAAHVLDCGLAHFFKPCNATGCLPAHDDAMAALDAAIEAQRAAKEAAGGGGQGLSQEGGGSWRRTTLVAAEGDTTGEVGDEDGGGDDGDDGDDGEAAR
jgi:hypothetical protein